MYRYIKVGESIICRFQKLDENIKYASTIDGIGLTEVIGELYDWPTKTWHKSIHTMKYDMSGDYEEITEEEAYKIINKE